MTKNSLNDKIEKVHKLIAAEEAAIAESKDKIKKYQKQLRKLNNEKDNQFASDFLKIISESGGMNDEQKAALLEQIKQATKNVLPIAHSEKEKNEEENKTVIASPKAINEQSDY